MREKYLGIWQTSTWREVAAEVRKIASGLHVRGLKRGDKISIIDDNRPRFYWTVLAAKSIGAVPVPIYQDSVADEALYVLEHAESRFVFAKNQEQVDKVLAIKDRCPRLESLLYCDPRGLRNYDVPFLHPYDDLIEEGQKFSATHPDFYLQEVAKGQADEMSIMLYTLGTTGQPKGVLLNYTNILVSSLKAVKFERLCEDDEILAYLPMAWVGDHIFSYGESLCAGFYISCLESADTVMNNVFEVGPTFFFAAPRIFENLMTTVMIGIEDASAIKRKLFSYFMDHAKEYGLKVLEGEPVPLGARRGRRLDPIFSNLSRHQLQPETAL